MHLTKKQPGNTFLGVIIINLRMRRLDNIFEIPELPGSAFQSSPAVVQSRRRGTTTDELAFRVLMKQFTMDDGGTGWTLAELRFKCLPLGFWSLD